MEDLWDGDQLMVTVKIDEKVEDGSTYEPSAVEAREEADAGDMLRVNWPVVGDGRQRWEELDLKESEEVMA